MEHKTYLWIEDKKGKSGYIFWETFMKQLCPEVLMESKKNNSELFALSSGNVYSDYALIPFEMESITVQDSSGEKVISDYEELKEWWENEEYDVIFGKINCVREDEIEIEVNEGDTHDYWLHTAANALRPLYQLVALAKMRPDCIWEGD
jgi:hypothetical protein